MAATTRYRTIVADPPWDHSDGTGVRYGTGVSPWITNGENRATR